MPSNVNVSPFSYVVLGSVTVELPFLTTTKYEKLPVSNTTAPSSTAAFSVRSTHTMDAASSLTSWAFSAATTAVSSFSATATGAASTATMLMASALTASLAMAWSMASAVSRTW